MVGSSIGRINSPGQNRGVYGRGISFALAAITNSKRALRVPPVTRKNRQSVRSQRSRIRLTSIGGAGGASWTEVVITPDVKRIGRGHSQATRLCCRAIQRKDRPILQPHGKQI